MSSTIALLKEAQRLRTQGWQRMARGQELIRRADAIVDQVSESNVFTVHRCVTCGLEYPLFADEKLWLEERGWVRKRCHDCMVNAGARRRQHEKNLKHLADARKARETSPVTTTPQPAVEAEVAEETPHEHDRTEP